MNYNKEIDRLKDKIQNLERARDKHKLFLVPVTWESGHNGDIQRYKDKVWAKDKHDATYRATHNDNGICVCEVCGEIEQIKETPKFDRNFNEIC